MAFRLNPHRSVSGELRRALISQVRGAEGRVPSSSSDKRAVHDARMKIKKARAIVTLLESADGVGLKKDRQRLRKAARALAGLRDSEVAVATYDALHEDVPLTPAGEKTDVRRRLLKAKRQAAGTDQREKQLRTVTRNLRKVRRSAKRWDISKMAPADLAGPLTTSYKYARRGLGLTVNSTEASRMHEWRKSVKTLWYHLQLLNPDTPPLRRRFELLTELQACLGKYQDFEVLKAAVTRRDGVDAEAEATIAAAEKMQMKLRAKALSLGHRAFSDTAGGFARELRRALQKSDNHPSAPRDARSAVA
jgi:CHAD domain-containing protein